MSKQTEQSPVDEVAGWERRPPLERDRLERDKVEVLRRPGINPSGVASDGLKVFGSAAIHLAERLKRLQAEPHLAVSANDVPETAAAPASPRFHTVEEGVFGWAEGFVWLPRSEQAQARQDKIVVMQDPIFDLGDREAETLVRRAIDYAAFRRRRGRQ